MNDHFSLPKLDKLDFEGPAFSNLGPLVAALGTLIMVVFLILTLAHF
jgi:hypothetical protein